MTVSGYQCYKETWPKKTTHSSVMLVLT